MDHFLIFGPSWAQNTILPCLYYNEIGFLIKKHVSVKKDSRYDL